MSPYHNVWLQCIVDSRHCLTYTAKLNSTLGTFSDKCPEGSRYDNFHFSNESSKLFLVSGHLNKLFLKTEAGVQHLSMATTTFIIVVQRI